MPPVTSPGMPAWVHHMAPPGNIGYMTKGIAATELVSMSGIPSKDQIGHNGESSPSMLQQQLVSTSQVNRNTCLRAMPDFAEVYSFVGSVFDPTKDGHLKRMREMAPIDQETVLLLMKNLSINISSPDFEEHKLFLSVYDMDPENTMAVGIDVKHLTGPTCLISRTALDDIDDTPVSGEPE